MKKLLSVLSLLIVATMILSACGAPATPTAAPATQAATEAPATEVAPATQAATEAPADANTLPRNETLYFNGQQWGAVVGWNPYSNSNNNAMTIAQQDSARVTMFETPYLYDMLDGKVYPLLADGDYAWNAEVTEVTFKIKAAAKWSDGTPVTADDVAYTWATHIKYETPTGAANKDVIDNIEAKDPQTVVVKAKLGEDGKALNPLLVN
ncbi:MAG TPA: ABC transporter substrate-binding protein, partial [Anaerolineales bacterium]|nr:ABC transporter substrate-binding protein [Anaerolineales bacterium]